MKLPKPPDPNAPRKSMRETILTSLPVVLTVVATVLAGLSSGEMTRAQYYRSMAAQMQAKASDQWSYFQAKRGRSIDALQALDLLSISAHPGSLDAGVLRAASAGLKQAAGGDAKFAPRAADLDVELSAVLAGPNWAGAMEVVNGHPPTVVDQPIASSRVLEAMSEVEKDQSEAVMAPLLRQITGDEIADAQRVVNDNLNAFDASFEPAGKVLDKLRGIFTRESQLWTDFVRGGVGVAKGSGQDIDSAQADVTAARLRETSMRYDREADYNKSLGQLCEVLVRQAGVHCTRAQARSALFFYCMLAAQAGVVISSLSLAIRRGNAFWLMAAVAGAAAVMASSYVYLFI